VALALPAPSAGVANLNLVRRVLGTLVIITLTALTVVYLTGGLGSVVIAGVPPQPLSTFSPSLAVFQPGARMNWTVAYRPNERPSAEETQIIQQWLGAILNDPYGWPRPGITWHYTTKPAIPELVFTVRPVEAVEQACGNDIRALGCTDTRHAGVCPIVLAQEEFTRIPFATLRAITNHEVGHCLGLAHTETGLMEPEIDITQPLQAYQQYPNEREVGYVAERIQGGLFLLGMAPVMKVQGPVPLRGAGPQPV
jgi:hypothetical protein